MVSITVVIGYTSEYFSILAADTRMFIDGKSENYIDNYVKLFELPEPMGWVAGSGFTHVLSEFVNIMHNFPHILHTDFNYIQTMFEKLKHNYPNFNETINRSNLYATWFFLDEQKQILRPTANYINMKHVISMAENTYFLDYPHDYSDDMVLEISKKYRLSDNHIDEFEVAIQKVLLIFDEISKSSEGVSKICDIGIQINTSTALVKHRFTDCVDSLRESIYNTIKLNQIK